MTDDFLKTGVIWYFDPRDTMRVKIPYDTGMKSDH
jgi:hypothetical protein